MKQGRWTEVEGISLLVFYKIARRIQLSDQEIEEEVIDMYTMFASHNSLQEDKMDLRHKSKNQIKCKLQHLTK